MARNRSGTTLRNRLTELSRHFSQSEIARKVGTSRVNVSRYLKGRRVPASFCVSLIEKLGVNPAWLMAGEGTMFLEDISAGTVGMAGDLLELVQAMESVAKMRLGALTGRQHMQVFRKLNDALMHYEELRDRLNEHSRPVFRRLLDEIKKAFIDWDIDRANQLRRAAQQVARLNDDEDLRREFNGRQGYIEARYGNNEAAIEFHRRAFASGLATKGELTQDVGLHAYNYANLLDRVGRLREGRRVCDAALSLLGLEQEDTESYLMLVVKRGLFDMELGDLRLTLSRAVPVIAHLNDDRRQRIYNTYVDALIFTGTLTWDSASAMVDYYQKPFTLLRFAIWLEDGPRLKKAWDTFGDHPERGLNPEMDRRQEFWFQALKAKDPAKLKGCTEKGMQHWELLYHRVIRTQAAWLAGDKRLALRHLREADAVLQGLGEGVTAWLWSRVFHYRNALRIPKSPLRKRAVAFFQDHLDKGYGLFREVIPS